MPELDALDAMVLTVVVTEAMCTVLTDELPKEVARGVVLLYDQLMQRAKPLLPKTEKTAYLFDAINRVEQIAGAIRLHHGLAPRV